MARKPRNPDFLGLPGVGATCGSPASPAEIPKIRGGVAARQPDGGLLEALAFEKAPAAGTP